MRAFCSGLEQRIHNLDESILLPSGKIVGREDSDPGGVRRLQDHGTPERRPISLGYIQRAKDGLGRICNYVPGRIVANDLAHFANRQRLPDLLPKIDTQLLQNLGADNSISGIPEAFDQLLGTAVFRSRGTVMRIHQNICVDKLLSAHAVRPATEPASIRDRILASGEPAPASAPPDSPGARARPVPAAQ